MFFIAGPQPQHIVSQYNQIVGKPFLPPFWSLGYHQCKFGYGSLNRTMEVLSQTQKHNIPIDVQWNDIDYMDSRKDFTYDHIKFKGLPQFVEELHQKGTDIEFTFLSRTNFEISCNFVFEDFNFDDLLVNV